MNLRVRSRAEVEGDLTQLVSDELRTIALRIIADLGGRPYQGRSLRGGLGDCRKVYFDVEGVSERPSFRVVYRLIPDERNPTEVDVIAVGPRANLDVYRRVRGRLGR